jgi:hypothetical protein
MQQSHDDSKVTQEQVQMLREAAAVLEEAGVPLRAKTIASRMRQRGSLSGLYGRSRLANALHRFAHLHGITKLEGDVVMWAKVPHPPPAPGHGSVPALIDPPSPSQSPSQSPSPSTSCDHPRQPRAIVMVCLAELPALVKPLRAYIAGAEGGDDVLAWGYADKLYNGPVFDIVVRATTDDSSEAKLRLFRDLCIASWHNVAVQKTMTTMAMPPAPVFIVCSRSNLLRTAPAILGESVHVVAEWETLCKLLDEIRLGAIKRE